MTLCHPPPLFKKFIPFKKKLLILYWGLAEESMLLNCGVKEDP